MNEGTQQDWAIIGGHFRDFAAGLPDRVLTHLKLLDGDYGGFPIDRLQHSLQTATRAHRDGRDEDYVVMALLHDIGDTLGSLQSSRHRRGDPEAVRRRETALDREYHGIFQGYYFFHYPRHRPRHAREFRGHPHFEACAASASYTTRRRSTRHTRARLSPSSSRWWRGCSRGRSTRSMPRWRGRLRRLDRAGAAASLAFHCRRPQKKGRRPDRDGGRFYACRDDQNWTLSVPMIARGLPI